MNKEWQLLALSWSEHEDYTEGLRLWKQRYGENITYRALCMGANDFNREKLRMGIMQGVDQAPVEPKPAAPLVPATEPAEIQAWKAQASQLMDERVLQKQRLRELPDPDRRAERKVVAYRIIEITETLDELFGKIGYWEQYGRVPVDVPETAETVALPQSLLNLRTYISRTQKKLNATTDPTKAAALAQQIRNWQQQIDQIRMQL